jgi:predicted PhzF superfamily epimerase YddE/YHI9
MVAEYGRNRAVKKEQVKIPNYQVDAFASEVFAGNPAAVCLLESWLENQVFQAIAAENSL